MAGFQSQAYALQAPGVLGNFASVNPFQTYPAGPGGLVAGSSNFQTGATGVLVGRFGWVSKAYIDNNNAGQIVNNFGSGIPQGFVGRYGQNNLITSYLGTSGLTIPAGFQMTLYTGGDFWILNEGSTRAQRGQKVYADFISGKASFAATGSATSASFTASIAAGTFSVTGSIADNQLTVTAVGSGTVVAGAVISGTSVVSGTTIVSQLSGTTGGVGVYAVSITDQAVASTTISGTFGTMTVTAVASGTIEPGGVVSGGTTAAGTVITAYGTGAGSTGTYIVNLTQTVTSGTLTSTTNVETRWYAVSDGAANELVKISSTPIA